LAAVVPPEQPAYDDFFAVEVALRALLPVLEAALQARVGAEGDFDGVREVDAALTRLAAALLSLELHGRAPLDEVHVRLRGCLMDAEQAVRLLT
jgi:hypothetical protein